MKIDTCTYIGHYPFRKTTKKTAEDLITLMDANGIDKAVVSSVQGIFYRDMMEGNLELFEEIAPFCDRLIPAANINPGYNSDLEDLERCVKEFGCREIRLWPQYTKRQTDGKEFAAVLKRCGELGVPAAFCVALSDPRGCHPLDVTSPLSAAEIVAAANQAPETDIVIHNMGMLTYVTEFAKLNRSGKVYYDIGQMESLFRDSLMQLVDQAGIDYVLYGSSAPLRNIASQDVRLHFYAEKTGTSCEDMEKIYAENAKKLYRID